MKGSRSGRIHEPPLSGFYMIYIPAETQREEKPQAVWLKNSA